jgi:hypothetical protein
MPDNLGCPCREIRPETDEERDARAEQGYEQQYPSGVSDPACTSGPGQMHAECVPALDGRFSTFARHTHEGQKGWWLFRTEADDNVAERAREALTETEAAYERDNPGRKALRPAPGPEPLFIPDAQGNYGPMTAADEERIYQNIQDARGTVYEEAGTLRRLTLSLSDLGEALAGLDIYKPGLSYDETAEAIMNYGGTR